MVVKLKSNGLFLTLNNRYVQRPTVKCRGAECKYNQSVASMLFPSVYLFKESFLLLAEKIYSCFATVAQAQSLCCFGGPLVLDIFRADQWPRPACMKIADLQLYSLTRETLRP